MPDKYVFQGFMAFAIFGPIPLSGKTLSCFAGNDDSKVQKKSRKQVREEEAQQRDHERAANVGGDDVFKRGVPVHEKKMAYQMASTAHVHAQKNARDLLAIANADHAATSKEFFEVVKLLKESTSEEEKETYKEWKEQLAKDLGGIRKRKRQLQEKCDSLMKVSKQESAMANDYFGRVSNVVKATSPVPQPSPLTVDTAVASHPAINKTSEEYQSHCSQLAQSQASEASSEMSRTSHAVSRAAVSLSQDQVANSHQLYSSQLACSSEFPQFSQFSQLSGQSFLSENNNNNKEQQEVTEIHSDEEDSSEDGDPKPVDPAEESLLNRCEATIARSRQSAAKRRNGLDDSDDDEEGEEDEDEEE
ncbi:unknown protein [Seminavis robusta]|uniref:Uncharacterized protein n=1 Tax=Seminavis robusta TaxID=568900 RepID=A0A9N8DEF5_9STRA|nr:unknown protein [Seminavis robusta]|eukprot:Sro56_g032860.1 n/a (361) ;mRNA; r:91209-92291